MCAEATAKSCLQEASTVRQKMDPAPRGFRATTWGGEDWEDRLQVSCVERIQAFSAVYNAKRKHAERSDDSDQGEGAHLSTRPRESGTGAASSCVSAR